LPAAVSVTADLPAGYNAPVCADNWTKWTFTVPAGTFTAFGSYAITLDREDGVCGVGSTVYTFTLSTPQLPLIAVSPDALCEDGNVTLNVAWKESSDNGNTWTDAGTAYTDDVTVTYKVKSLNCTPDTWSDPSTLGLPNTLTITGGGSLSVPVGDPGKTALYIESVSYTHAGCGTITIDNGTAAAN
jgi:hypothetical protein